MRAARRLSVDLEHPVETAEIERHRPRVGVTDERFHAADHRTASAVGDRCHGGVRAPVEDPGDVVGVTGEGHEIGRMRELRGQPPHDVAERLAVGVRGAFEAVSGHQIRQGRRRRDPRLTQVEVFQARRRVGRGGRDAEQLAHGAGDPFLFGRVEGRVGGAPSPEAPSTRHGVTFARRAARQPTLGLRFPRSPGGDPTGPDERTEVCVDLVTNVIHGEGRDRILLLAHGYGADEQDLGGVMPFLDPDGTLLTVLPRGPLSAPPGYSWYDVAAGPEEMTKGFIAGVGLLDAVLEETAREHDKAREEAIVGGFSQGAGLALALAMSGDRPHPKAVLVMSGLVPGGLDATFDWEGAREMPVLVQHGIHDPMIPVDRSRELARTLAAHDVPVVYREYPMQHQIAQESIADRALLVGPGGRRGEAERADRHLCSTCVTRGSRADGVASGE